MSQIDTVKTWLPGDSVDAAGMNAIIDQATALIGIINDQTAAVGTLDAADDILVVQGGVLKRANISQLIQGVSTVGWETGNPAPASVFSGSVSPTSGDARIHLGLDSQSGNKVLASPADGTSATPAFRVLTPADTIMYHEVSALTFDCTLGNVFRKILSGVNTTIHLLINNGSLGQRITIYLIQGASPGQTEVTWDTQDPDPAAMIRWPGGVNHTMTRGLAGDTDILNFLCMGSGLYYGTFDKSFSP